MRAVSDTDTLGAELRAARENRDLSLAQVEKQTRIRIHYLAALEADEYAELPSAVQARGFLRNYARFLGLDADNLEARFNAVLYNQSRRGRQIPVFDDDPTPTLPSASRRTSPRAMPPPTARSTPSRESQAAGRNKSRTATQTVAANRPGGSSADERARARRARTRNMTLGTLAIVAASIAAFALVLTFVMRNNAANAVSPILSPLPPTETFTPSPTDLPTSTLPTPLPNPNATAAVSVSSGGTGLAVQITVRERAPLKITVDGQLVYNGVPVPNTVLKYQAKTSVQIHTGDAGGIDVVVNGAQQPALGPAHAIADKTYTANGASSTNSTATSAPTASIIAGPTVTTGFKP